MLRTLFLALLPACAPARCGAPAPVTPADTSGCPAPTGAYEATVRVRPRRSAGDSVLVVTVCLLARPGEKPVGSYHGELRFDSLGARVVRVDHAPDGVRVENPNVPGRIAF